MGGAATVTVVVGSGEGTGGAVTVTVGVGSGFCVGVGEAVAPALEALGVLDLEVVMYRSPPPMINTPRATTRMIAVQLGPLDLVTGVEVVIGTESRTSVGESPLPRTASADIVAPQEVQ